MRVNVIFQRVMTYLSTSLNELRGLEATLEDKEKAKQLVVYFCYILQMFWII